MRTEFISQDLSPQQHEPVSVGNEQLAGQEVALEDLGAIFRQSDALIYPDRIHASSQEGPFGRTFGRDSVITAEAKLASYSLSPNGQLDKIIPPITALHRLVSAHDVPFAGIHRGDLIHETGTIEDGYPEDWFAIGDRRGFNYDALDGADRLIILDYRLIMRRPELYPEYIDSIELMIERGVQNTREFEGAGYIGARYDKQRLFPGVTDKRWRDGYASTVSDDLSIPAHPIRPVEEQALRWSALQYGSELVEGRNPELASQARETAEYLQQQFLDNFVYHDAKGAFIADAVDANGNKLHAITIDEILVLLHDYHGRTILDDPMLEQAVVKRSFHELFSQGGFKTVSENGPVHPLNKYQGPKSRWPHANAMAVRAIDAEVKRTQDPRVRAELQERANRLGEAMLGPFIYFGSPVEGVQVTDDGGYTLEYDKTSDGRSLQYAKVQAWAGAGGEYVTHFLKSQGKTHIHVALPLVTQAA